MSHLGPTRTARAHRITRERARANSLSSLRENGTRLLLETPGGGSLRGGRSGRGLSPTARAASSFQAGQGGLLISRTETTGASLLSHFRQLDPRFRRQLDQHFRQLDHASVELHLASLQPSVLHSHHCQLQRLDNKASNFIMLRATLGVELLAVYRPWAPAWARGSVAAT